MRIMTQMAGGLRTRIRKPGFALAVVLILALGIGANTATLNLLYGYILAPLPYPHADRLVSLYFTAKDIPGNLGMSYPTYFSLRADTTGMLDAGMAESQSLNLVSGRTLEHVHGAALSASMFTTLAVRPILGRLFGARANEPGAARQVLLSEPLWRRLFDRSPAVLGRAVHLNGRLYTVIGVMPRTFQVPDAQTDLWVPEVIGPFDRNRHNLTAWGETMIARLAPGVSPAQLAVRAQAALQREFAHFPDPSAIPLFRRMGMRIAVRPLRGVLLGSLGERLALAQLATGLLLLLVWFNLANLFIARALERRGELIVRRVLGADEWMLFRQLFLESLTLSVLGSLLGVALGEFLVHLLLSLGFGSPAFAFPLRDWTVVVLIALALAMLSALVFSVAGLHFVRRQDLSQGLRDADARSSGGRDEHRVRGALVVTQLALAFTLCGMGAMLAHSLINLDGVRLGFRARHIVTFQIELPPGRAAGWRGRLRSQLATLHAALSRLPGVSSATLASDVPFDGGAGNNSVYPYPYVGKRSPNIFPVITDPGYFRTLGIHLLAGRLFQVRDAAAPSGVAVIDARAAHELFGQRDAVGRQFTFDDPNDTRPNLRFRVIGVVSDTRHAHLGAGQPEGSVYLDRGQVLQLKGNGWSWASPTWYVAVRTPLQAAQILPALGRTVAATLPGIPIYGVRSMTERLARRVAPRRTVTALMLMFALGALAVAAVGLYSVQSYLVGRRTPEFGLRAALGADAARLRRMVLREVGRLLALGSVFGVIAVIILGRVFSASFYDVRSADPLALMLVATVLGVIAMLAGWLPARRASRIPPVEALRDR